MSWRTWHIFSCTFVKASELLPPPETVVVVTTVLTVVVVTTVLTVVVVVAGTVVVVVTVIVVVVIVVTGEEEEILNPVFTFPEDAVSDAGVDAAIPLTYHVSDSPFVAPSSAVLFGSSISMFIAYVPDASRVLVVKVSPDAEVAFTSVPVGGEEPSTVTVPW